MKLSAILYAALATASVSASASVNALNNATVSPDMISPMQAMAHVGSNSRRPDHFCTQFVSECIRYCFVHKPASQNSTAVAHVCHKDQLPGLYDQRCQCDGTDKTAQVLDFVVRLAGATSTQNVTTSVTMTIQATATTASTLTVSIPTITISSGISLTMTTTTTTSLATSLTTTSVTSNVLTTQTSFSIATTTAAVVRRATVAKVAFEDVVSPSSAFCNAFASSCGRECRRYASSVKQQSCSLKSGDQYQLICYCKNGQSLAVGSLNHIDDLNVRTATVVSTEAFTTTATGTTTVPITVTTVGTTVAVPTTTSTIVVTSSTTRTVQTTATTTAATQTFTTFVVSATGVIAITDLTGTVAEGYLGNDYDDSTSLLFKSVQGLPTDSNVANVALIGDGPGAFDLYLLNPGSMVSKPFIGGVVGEINNRADPNDLSHSSYNFAYLSGTNHQNGPAALVGADKDSSTLPVESTIWSVSFPSNELLPFWKNTDGSTVGGLSIVPLGSPTHFDITANLTMFQSIIGNIPPVRWFLTIP